jgi:hydrogenase maturation protein HypF
MTSTANGSSLHYAQLEDAAELIRVRGTVQGVGFRPMVWRLARSYGLRGWVANDAQGVLILACGSPAVLAAFIEALPGHAPPLASISAVERNRLGDVPNEQDFRIVTSSAGSAHTNVTPDAGSCLACVAETLNPSARRFQYPFTNCTHCGPRLTIIEGIPYDRAATTMRGFSLCAACSAEYADPGDRRFHAQPVACKNCGPGIWLERAAGAFLEYAARQPSDDQGGVIAAAAALLGQSHIVAIKGLGGIQLACDACDEVAVQRLRQQKQRDRKPFALMARDLDVVRLYASVNDMEAALLQSTAAPIVILDANGTSQVATAVAPGMSTLGFMLPNTPLHHLLMRTMQRPLVLTSGNLADEPQCIDNADARDRLGRIADFLLLHDRGIACRVDDSVVRVMAGAPRSVRRSRGYAPAPIVLPATFSLAPAVLAMGGDLKNTFCLLRGGEAILSHHMGDLEDARCQADYRQSVDRYLHLFEFEPHTVAIDQHPEYQSRKLGIDLAERRGCPQQQVQHHHAHLAACMAENGVEADADPVIGVVLDGLGFGADGTLWGGEFLFADYRRCTRLASFKPVAMPGGELAAREPWRNTYAQLVAGLGWELFAASYWQLDLYRFLAGKPRVLLDRMIANSVNSPPASSCGRLFDAAAAAAGVCRERVLHEGQAAVEFETLVDANALRDEPDGHAYPFSLTHPASGGVPYVECRGMWLALLDDLARATPIPLVAMRFHKGLAIGIARVAARLAGTARADATVTTVALSGGVFQNRVLLEQVSTRLRRQGFKVLSHRLVPANDGGLALGQAAVAAARLLAH